MISQSTGCWCMSVKGMLMLCMLFVVVPAFTGVIWVRLLRTGGGWNGFLHAWVCGFVTILAAGQLVLVPFVAMQQTLTTAIMCWKIVLTVLAVISFYLVLLHGQELFRIRSLKKGEKQEGGGERSANYWTAVFGVLAAVLILLQAWVPARYEHSDDDDARFVAEEVSAVVHDTMYQDSPIVADFMFWNTGEVRKDLTSPWAMYVAMNCRISGYAPAVLSHSYLPFFLILLCYAVYLLLGRSLFGKDMEKVFVFLILISVLHLWGYTSTHTLASMLLLRIWQGKAVCAGFILPVFFYVFCEVMRRKYRPGYIAFLYVASVASCLLSGIGIVTAPIILFLYGLVDYVCHRKWRKTFAIWMAALPCAVFLGYYLIG